MNPDHLIDLAAEALREGRRGRDRQARPRRGISSCYYGLFHAILRAIADEFVGRKASATHAYVTLYRSIDHRQIKSACEDVKRRPKVFGKEISNVAKAFVDLYDKRHLADYDPNFRCGRTDVESHVELARTARLALERADKTRRRDFLARIAFARGRG